MRRPPTLPWQSLERRLLLSAALPRIELFADASVATEGFGDTLRYTIERDATAATPLTVKLAVTGASSSDFASIPASVTIPANARTATVVLTPLNDAIAETRKTLRVDLVTDPAYTLGPASTKSAQGRLFDDDNLRNGTPVFDDSGLGAFYSFGSTVTTVAATPPAGASFTQARRVAVTTLPDTTYAAGLRARNTAAVAAGDKLLLKFWVRSVDGSPIHFTTVIEEEGGSYTRSASFGVSMRSTQWKQVVVPAQAAASYAPGTFVAGLQIGGQVQTFDIAGVELLNYRNTVALADMPISSSNWQGRTGTDTAWRDAADARIDQLRKADLHVVVRDASGNVIPDAQVHVKLKQHAFGFGSAVDAWSLLGIDPSDRAQYQQIIRNNFSKVVLENDLKWPEWQNDAQQAVDAIDWLNANGITKVRGHNLIWPYWGYMPASPGSTYGGINYRSDPNKADSLEEYEAHVSVDGAPAALAWLRQRVLTHIQSETSDPRLKGRIVDWDVVNEPTFAGEFLDVVGTDQIPLWLAAARAGDPNARLFVNDYPDLDGGAQLDALYRLITNLKAQNAAVDGVGLQTHLNAATPDIDQVLATFNRFGALGLPLQITEFDIVNADEQVQADYLRDMMTAAFSTGSIDTFLIWGFWESRHWQPDAALWRSDWSIKPNGQRFIDMVNAIWTTDQTLATDAVGSTSLRGFMGTYDIVVTHGSSTRVTALSLGTDGATVNVTLPDTTAPQVTQSNFDVNAPAAVFVFSETVAGSTAIGDLVVVTDAAGQTVARDRYAVWVDAARRVVVRFAVANGLKLPDAQYLITLKPSAVRDLAGNGSVEATLSFRVLAGDANEDGSVNFDDLLVLAQNYGRQWRTYREGNFDYSADGSVGFDELLLLVQKLYGPAYVANTVPGISSGNRRS